MNTPDTFGIGLTSMPTDFDQGNPSFDRRDPLPLVELPADCLKGLLNENNSHLKLYRLGGCSVIVTREFKLWHLSIARTDRYPNWDEIAEARYRILPGHVTMALLLPPKGQYINLHENCFQLKEIAVQGKKKDRRKAGQTRG